MMNLITLLVFLQFAFIISFDFPSHKIITKSYKISMSSSSNVHHDLLVRAYRGEEVSRVPVWLMRQAGRYMKEFRAYSEKYPFRQRSETPEIAIELSLQPWRRFGVDGVIMFSDILTPLPSLGVDFTIIEGKGPKIMSPVRTSADVDLIKPFHDVEKQVPFLGPILRTLSKETKGKTSLIGFIGAPWTLAAYSVEGGHSKLCKNMKGLCLEQPELAHRLLDKYTESLISYSDYQISCGAQVLQVFESWAHHLSEDMFEEFAKPYANRIGMYLKSKYPDVPVVYFANGGSVFLESQKEMNFNALSLDWRIAIKQARRIVGSDRVLAGNIDPMVLYGSRSVIENTVHKTIVDVGKSKFVFNLGHGVEKDMSEENVEILVNAVHNFKFLASAIVRDIPAEPKKNTLCVNFLELELMPRCANRNEIPENSPNPTRRH